MFSYGFYYLTASSLYVKDQNKQRSLDSRAEISNCSKSHSGVYSHSLEFTKNGINDMYKGGSILKPS